MSLTVAPIPPERLEAALPEVARLRIAVFRAWPYLYEGDMGYEAKYLRAYLESPGAIVVGAWDGDRLVGAATGSPMEDHADEFGAPFLEAGYDLGDVFYCAELVLDPAYRGRGVGHAFFDHREARGRALGRRWSTFCGVVRPSDHPARPADHRPLDGFWRKRGYEKAEGLTAGFSWRDLGDEAESEKRMQFWMREL